MGKVLIISAKKYFIVSSLVRQLEDCGHIVMHADNASEIEKMTDEVQLIILYIEEGDMKNFSCLRDMILDVSLPFVVMGDINPIAEIKTLMPHQSIKKTFQRPINLKETCEQIDEYLQEETCLFKKKILVVDDSGTALRSIKGWLEDKYQVVLANSGTMAIRYMVTNRPDLVLLDYEMPICDGRQVLEMIRSENDLADIPVIFLTNKNDRESVCKVTALKPEGYLLKTMEPALIVKAIDNFFDKKKWDW